MTDSVPSSQRQRASGPWRWTPPTQRSTPLRATWSASPQHPRAGRGEAQAGGGGHLPGGRVQLDQRHPVPASRARMRKQNRSARNGRASRSPSRANTAPALGSPPCWVAARRRRSVRERPSRVEGYSRPSRSKASPRKRSWGERLAATSPSPPGSAARSRPGGGAQVEGLGGQRGGGLQQAGELPGLELAQPAEVGDAGVLADADQPDPVRRHPEVAERGQDLGELELVVQVGLEPEQVVAGVVDGQGAVALLEPAPHRPASRPSAAARNSARTRRSPASSSPAGTGPSCRTSAQASASAASPARRRWSTTMSPLVTCSVVMIASDGRDCTHHPGQRAGRGQWRREHHRQGRGPP